MNNENVSRFADEFLLLLKFLLVILIETWYNLLVVYYVFCNSIILQKRLLSYPFRISLQSFLLGLFFYSPFCG